MTEENVAPCRCQASADPTCGCGCQSSEAAKGCTCGPQCLCGDNCPCAAATDSRP
jgi:hypothetical protein